jgi:hypothetical protein
MFQYVLSCTVTVMVQGGTWWFMTVQRTVYGGTWRYIAVQESVKLYILVCSGTYLFLRSNLDPGQLDSLLQCCPAEGAVFNLKTSASNHSNASSSMFQSRSLGLATASAAPGEASVAPPERGGGQQRLPPQQGPAVAQQRRSRLEVPRHCCRRRQRRQWGRALVRMQPW